MKSPRIGKSLIVMMTLVLVAGCGGGTPDASAPGIQSSGGSTSNSAPASTTNIALGASTTSTWVYAFSVAMSETINPLMPHIKVYPEATAGSTAHYEMIDQGVIEMGTGSTFADNQAIKGEGSFTKKYDTIYSMFPVNKTVCQIVVHADSNFKKLSDLQGKKIAIGGRGSPTSVMSEAVLASLNITADLSISTHEEMIEMFKDGRVDAIIYFGGAPYSGILDIAAGMSIRLLPISAEEQDKITAYAPSLSRGFVVKEAYAFITQDVPVVASMSDLVVRKDVPEDVVYQIVKNAQEHWGDIAVTMPAANSVGLEDINGMVLPLHPGALKYYTEKGIAVDGRLKP